MYVDNLIKKLKIEVDVLNVFLIKKEKKRDVLRSEFKRLDAECDYIRDTKNAIEGAIEDIEFSKHILDKRCLGE